MAEAALSNTREQWFQWSKYLIYALLFTNIFAFFAEEWAAADHMLVGDWTLGLFIETFPATIDTVAWVALLLMFELETWHLNPQTMTLVVKRTLLIARVLCYGLILSAFAGYTEKLLEISSAPSISAAEFCRDANHEFKLRRGLDDFEGVGEEICRNDRLLRQHDEQRWVATIEDYERFKGLAWIDVLNAAAWLVIVSMLEFEIRTGLKARASRQSVNALNSIKGLLYLGLVGFAIYWGIDGKPIDFWDAFLWIVAFVYIERNLFIPWEDAALSMEPSSAPQS